ncbi:MAG: dihydroneopterin aldolase [Nocardioidaceae bacterium]
MTNYSAAEDRPGYPAGDRIAVRGIAARGHHGVFDFERREGQSFVVDLVLGVDTRGASASDDLRDTVDYGSLVATVRDAVENDPVNLIETLAERISQRCLTGVQAGWVEVTVHKPNAPIEATFSDVAVTILRSRGADQ